MAQLLGIAGGAGGIQGGQSSLKKDTVFTASPIDIAASISAPFVVGDDSSASSSQQDTRATGSGSPAFLGSANSGSLSTPVLLGLIGGGLLLIFLVLKK